MLSRFRKPIGVAGVKSASTEDRPTQLKERVNETDTLTLLRHAGEYPKSSLTPAPYHCSLSLIQLLCFSN